MALGISTACLYPMAMEDSLQTLIDSGFREFEIFINTYSEMEPEFLTMLEEKLKPQGCRVKSLHPFTSGFESYLLFSNYERRFQDGAFFYRRYFEMARRLGAEILVIHGDRSFEKSGLNDREYYDRFGILSRIAREYGVTLAQENVNAFRSQDCGFIRNMREYLKEDASFVLDVKQAVRSGRDPYEMCEAMGKNLVHIHINDNRPGRDCLLPGRGEMDYARLLSILRENHYRGDFIIEVYRKDFAQISELADAYRFLQSAGFESCFG